MKITGPLFKWFGSKYQASRLHREPLYNIIFEPYAGSAGYGLRHFNRDVVIYDANTQLSQLWQWLIKEANTDLVMEIPIGLPYGANILNVCLPNGKALSRGQALLLKHWQRPNSVGNCWTTSPWGDKPGQWTQSTRARVAREVHCIKHWQFRPIEFTEPGTYFVDPPYLYNYRYRMKGFDHGALANALRRLPPASQVIACEAVCQKTGRVPDYLPFEFFASRVTSRRRKNNNHHSQELVYYFQS